MAVLLPLYIATVSFFTIFTEGTEQKITAAVASLVIFPVGWMIQKLSKGPSQIPFDAVEEFGSSHGYEIIVPTPLWARQSSYDVAQQKFGSDTIPPATLDEMGTRSPNSLLVLTYGGSVVGYTDVYAMEAKAVQRFLCGEISERDLTPEMIVAHPRPGTASDLYLAGIVVVDCQSYEGRRQASMLIWALVEMLAKCFLDGEPARLFALGWSAEGRALLEKASFSRVASTRSRKDGHPLYTRSTTRAECEQWLTRHRNWEGVCKLQIDCKASRPPPRRRRRERVRASVAKPLPK